MYKVDLGDQESLECKIEPDSGLLISKDGRVFKEIPQWKDKYGYSLITQNHKNIFVHRLVAKAFVPGQTEKTPVVMHKDDNPRNNNASNLEWGTYQKNNMDAVLRGLRKGRVKRVRCIETGEVFPSAREASRQMFGKSKPGDHILQVCKLERNMAYGYHWEVAE
jgi:hypothetical protein